MEIEMKPRRSMGVAVAVLAWAAAVQAEEPSRDATLLPHAASSWFWISGQANFIEQWHDDFPAGVAGPVGGSGHQPDLESGLQPRPRPRARADGPRPRRHLSVMSQHTRRAT
jgi:hypothetical protein